MTETTTVTVEVSHEEFRLVNIPITDAEPNRRHLDPAEQDDPARWLYLSREEVVITKRIVPVERIRLEVYPVIEQRRISEQLQKEQIAPTD